MMLNRYGAPLIMGWSDHQILWIEAAMTLPREERRAAFVEIADLTGRNYIAVHQKACRIAKGQHEGGRRQRLLTFARAYEERQPHV